MTYCGVAAVSAARMRAEEKRDLDDSIIQQRNNLIREGLYSPEEIDRIMAGDHEGIPSALVRQAEINNGLIVKKTRSVWVN
jgi:hypothetical protein